MPTPTFQPPQGQQSTAQLQDWIVKLVRDLNYLFGNLDTVNINRLDANVIIAHTITAVMMNVSQLSAITADMGTLTAGQIFGAYIATANGTYPRIELSSTGNLLTAYHDANNFVALNPGDATTPDPLLFFKSPGNVGTINNNPSDTFLVNASNKLGLTSANSDIIISALFGSITAFSAAGFVSDVPSAINTAQSTANSALSGLSGKANAFSGDNAVLIFDGAPMGLGNVTLTFSNGILVSVTS